MGWPSPQGMLMKLPCVYCANRLRDVCAECEKEDKFRHLAPEILYDWEWVSLPPFHELVETNSYERLAIIYLALYYLHKDTIRE